MHDLLIKNARIATWDERSPIPDVEVHEGCIGIMGGQIAYVDPKPRPAKQVLDAAGALVTPGYVDAHNHLTYMGDRAFELALKLQGVPYMEILAKGGGIAHTTRATRAASIEALVDAGRPRVQEMLHNGITTLEAKSGYGLETATELRQLEASVRLANNGPTVVPTFLGAHAVPAEFQDDVDGYVDLVAGEMMDAVRAQGVARFCDVFVEEGAFTVDHGRKIFKAAKAAGLGLRLHADEIVNTGGAELAAEAGAMTADHLARVSEDGIEAMAKRGTMAVMMPSVPITLRDPAWPPARRMVEAGIPIALGTDHNPNNPVTSMTLVVQLSCYLLGLTPAQAIVAATMNAAHSLGLKDRGVIAPGKRADLILHDVPSLDHLATRLGHESAATVVMGGRLLA